jgi:hypothetical protein
VRGRNVVEGKNVAVCAESRMLLRQVVEEKLREDRTDRLDSLHKDLIEVNVMARMTREVRDSLMVVDLGSGFFSNKPWMNV